MEDYDKFAHLRLSHLRKRQEENDRSSPAPSLIRFYGQSILPPLMSGERREEMQRHRDAAQKAAVHRQLKVEGRMAYVQTILRGVQLRKTPTLEDLLQESEIDTKSSHSHDASDESTSQSRHLLATKDALLTPPAERKEGDVFSVPPQTSATHGAFFASDATPQEICQEQCLTDKHYSQQGSQPNSLNGAASSGYMANENLENTTSVSGGKEAWGDSHGFGSLEGVSHMGGFLLHDTNTIAKMSDIIIHPPIDGEELERSGQELSFSNGFMLVKDIFGSLIQDDSIKCDHSPEEKCKSSHVDSTEDGDNLPVTTALDLDRDHSLDRIESLISSPENSGSSDNPASPQPLSTIQRIRLDPCETEPADNNEEEAGPSDGPYRLSLQALLKRSQEYRRRQRILRNQAKNTKIHETTQEQARARTEERSLSDKENDEFPSAGNVTADGRQTTERRGTFMPSVQTLPKKSKVSERMIEGESFGKKASLKSESTNLTGNGNTKEINVQGETLKNKRQNISQEVVTEPKEISTFPCQQDRFTETSLEDFHPPTYSTAFHKGLRKCNTILAPNFCRSPVHCKRKGSIQDVEVSNEPQTSKMEVFLNMGLTKDQKVEEVYRKHPNRHKAVPFIVDLMVEGDATRASASCSQHIDQLESTLTENPGNHGQTGHNMESHFSFEDVKHLEHMHLYQSDSVGSEGKRKNGTNDHDVEQDQRYREGRRKQSLDNFKNMPEDTGSQPSITDTDNVPPTAQFIGTETVNLSQLRLLQTSATEGAQAKGECKEILTKSNGQHGDCRKQQPPAKCILSVAQRRQIPEVFRETPSGNTAPHNVSVLLDSSNHQEERRPETAVEGHDSTALSSLHQSHDVDAPCGPWSLEGTAPDLGPSGHLVPEKHLTPRSGGGGQGYVSKVKRRLLMQGMQETADASRGGGSTVRPKSSTPTVWWQEGHGVQRDEQEQLKNVQAAQLRALQDEHRRQEEELLQALAVRYHVLQSMSFPCSMSSSHLGDTLTFSTLSQPSRPMSERCRPLLLAVVKGFLTRRLLKTERVAQLVLTIKDTQQFLQALRHQSPGRGESCSRENLLLQERATVQLRAARFKVNDIFFNLPAEEKMQLISWDRELARERERKQLSGHKGEPRGKSSLSAATRKSLERKRGMMIQKKAAERHRGVVTRDGNCTASSVEQLPETKGGQFKANPQRVPKTSNSSRPR